MAVNNEHWYQIVGKDFASGLCIEDGIVTRAAPILSRFKGRTATELFKWVKQNKFKVYYIRGNSPKGR